jgi:hypothetical protein
MNSTDLAMRALTRIASLVDDDAHAISFQSLRQYRLALLTAIGRELLNLAKTPS